MISPSTAMRNLQIMRSHWQKEEPYDFARGVVYGLLLAVKMIKTMQVEALARHDRSPFIWKTWRIRQMIQRAIRCFLRADRARGIELLERVLQKKGAKP